MKVETRTNDVQSTMMGEKVAMGVSTEDIGHIMGVLTDLYKDRLLAVIREYSTNALDAHIEAGVSLPIEVTLPSAFAPTLEVRDYGVGLDADDIRQIYSQYGRSTKRATNDQVGMLGLGCKSALTYTSQFTVTSVKDGRRVIVLVSRDEDGAGHMQILSDEPTDDANGTVVSVGIRREDHMYAQRHANEFFSYWAEGTVLVNGNAPERFDGLRVTDELWIVDEFSRDKIVMGNVAYPANIDHGLSGLSVVAFVPIGSVKPTPSREALMDTTLTKTTMNKVTEDFNAAIPGAIQREVDAAATPFEAVSIVAHWAQKVVATFSGFTYKGEPLPVSISEPGMIYTAAAGWRKGSSVNVRDVRSRDWPGIVWVHGYTPTKFVASHKNKLLRWCADNNQQPQSFVLMPGAMPANKFIDPARVVDWEDVRKIKLVVGAPSGPSGRIPGSYDIALPGAIVKYGVPGSDIRQDKPIFFANCNGQAGRIKVNRLTEGGYEDFTLVCLPANRVAKFRRDVPAAKSFDDAIREAREKWLKTLSNPKRSALGLSGSDRRELLALKDVAHKIADPAIVQAIRAAEAWTPDLYAKGSALGYAPDTTENPLDEYPLYDASAADHPHTLLYLNAAFQTKEDNA